MVKNFKSETAKAIYNGTENRYARKLPTELHGKVRRLFDQLNAITKIETLRIPPSNRLESLSENLKDYWSLRINKKWRVIFRWENGHALDVDIVDYH